MAEFVCLGMVIDVIVVFWYCYCISFGREVVVSIFGVLYKVVIDCVGYVVFLYYLEVLFKCMLVVGRIVDILDVFGNKEL